MSAEFYPQRTEFFPAVDCLKRKARKPAPRLTTFLSYLVSVQTSVSDMLLLAAQLEGIEGSAKYDDLTTEAQRLDAQAARLRDALQEAKP